MVRARENVNQNNLETRHEEIIAQQWKESKQILTEMIELVNKTPGIEYSCGIGLTEYYETRKRDLLSKHRQLVINYRQSELESDYQDLILILAELRRNIEMISGVPTQMLIDYQKKMISSICRHLLEC